jgi:hypothetical protein
MRRLNGWELGFRVALCAAGIAGCSAGSATDAGPVADVGRDAQERSDVEVDAGVDAAPPPYDAGPPPACEGPARVRRVLDRPGGDRVGDPGELLAVGSGFLVPGRYVEERVDAVDGGVGDGARDGGAPFARTVLADRAVVIALDREGAPRPAVTLFDGASSGTSAGVPRLHAAGDGVLALAQELRGNASGGDFVLRTRGAVLGADGTLRRAFVARERVSLPESTTVSAGVFGVAFRIDAVADGGLVTASPIGILLDGQGMDARTPDSLLTAVLPSEPRDLRMRARGDGRALLFYTREGQLGFVPFDGRGVPEPTGSFEVRGSTAPTLDDAVSVGDGVIAAWSRTLVGGTTEVRVIVASHGHTLRLNRELERFTGEGGTSVTVVPAYGGAAILWRRGVDAMARIRVSVVSPDGAVRLEPTDLVSVPAAEGRVSASASGRELSFVVRDGTRADRWGWTFGRACLPLAP